VKRVALDTIEMLFSGFSDEAILRSELKRLFRFLKEKGGAAVITGTFKQTTGMFHRI